MGVKRASDVTAAYNQFIQVMHSISVPADPVLLNLFNQAKFEACEALTANTAVLEYIKAAQAVRFHEREIESAREIQKAARLDPGIDSRIRGMENEQALKNPPATGD